MSKYAIEELIAHKSPMALLARMVSYDEASAVCEVDISESSPFFSLI